jgi:hypothetical protein
MLKQMLIGIAKSINTGTTGILVQSFSSGTGLSLRNQGGRVIY